MRKSSPDARATANKYFTRVIESPKPAHPIGRVPPIGVVVTLTGDSHEFMNRLRAAAYTNLAGDLIARKDSRSAEQCRQYLCNAIDLDPNEPRHRYNLGFYYETRGDLERAAVTYRETLIHHPHHILSHARLGLVLKRREDWAGAAEHYREALRLYAESGGGASVAGTERELTLVLEVIGTRYTTGDPPEDLNGGIRLLREVVAIRTRSPHGDKLVLANDYFVLANALQKKSEGQKGPSLDESIDLYRAARKNGLDSEVLLVNLAAAIRSRGVKADLDEAIGCCHQALVQNPRRPNTHNILALCFRARRPRRLGVCPRSSHPSGCAELGLRKSSHRSRNCTCG